MKPALLSSKVQVIKPFVLVETSEVSSKGQLLQQFHKCVFRHLCLVKMLFSKMHWKKVEKIPFRNLLSAKLLKIMLRNRAIERILNNCIVFIVLLFSLLAVTEAGKAGDPLTEVFFREEYTLNNAIGIKI